MCEIVLLKGFVLHLLDATINLAPDVFFVHFRCPIRVAISFKKSEVKKVKVLEKVEVKIIRKLKK